MINGEWNKTQNDAPFLAFYDMQAVTFILPDETKTCRSRDCSGLLLYPINPHRVSQAKWFQFQNLFTSRKKYRIWNKNNSTCCNPTTYKESSHSSLILVTSYDMP